MGTEGVAGVTSCSRTAHDQNVLAREGARPTTEEFVLASSGGLGEVTAGAGGEKRVKGG